MNWSSEAIKKGIFPPKLISEMTQKELADWRNSLDPDMMGFDGEEYPIDQGDDNGI